VRLRVKWTSRGAHGSHQGPLTRSCRKSLLSNTEIYVALAATSARNHTSTTSFAMQSQSAVSDFNRSVEIVRDNIFASERLIKGGPLDHYGIRKNPELNVGLDNLDCYLVGIQHSILRHVDVATFLDCRRVSRRAQAVTGSLHKVERVRNLRLQTPYISPLTDSEIMQHQRAANAIRMAVAIDTAKYFTIPNSSSRFAVESATPRTVQILRRTSMSSISIDAAYGASVPARQI